MRLVELDPQWIMKDGKRIGFHFLSPVHQPGSMGASRWRQSCFPDPPPTREQWELFDELDVQGCNPAAHWQIAGGIESATFETMTVTPSLDGSKGGLWHGFITNGEIVGGL